MKRRAFPASDVRYYYKDNYQRVSIVRNWRKTMWGILFEAAWNFDTKNCFSANAFCDPLGDWNIWGTLYPMTTPLKEKEAIIISTRVTLFDNWYLLNELLDGEDRWNWSFSLVWKLKLELWKHYHSEDGLCTVDDVLYCREKLHAIRVYLQSTFGFPPQLEISSTMCWWYPSQ